MIILGKLCTEMPAGALLVEKQITPITDKADAMSNGKVLDKLQKTRQGGRHTPYELNSDNPVLLTSKKWRKV